MSSAALSTNSSSSLVTGRFPPRGTFEALYLMDLFKPVQKFIILIEDETETQRI